jgi:hypothetical protein
VVRRCIFTRVITITREMMHRRENLFHGDYAQLKKAILEVFFFWNVLTVVFKLVLFRNILK